MASGTKPAPGKPIAEKSNIGGGIPAAPSGPKNSKRASQEGLFSWPIPPNSVPRAPAPPGIPPDIAALHIPSCHGGMDGAMPGNCPFISCAGPDIPVGTDIEREIGSCVFDLEGEVAGAVAPATVAWAVF